MLDMIQVAQANDDALQKQLIRHEGLKLKPYLDTVGKLTIGVGRNLADVGISPDEALDLLANDITRVKAGLDVALPWWRDLDAVRKRVLIDMAFNLGVEGLRAFRLALSFTRSGDFDEAATEMLASKWAGQVGQRAKTLAQMMHTGQAT